MITAHICGGLGNQLFQYATARRLAITSQLPLTLDLSWFRSANASDTPREPLLLRYQIVAKPLPQYRERVLRILQTRIGPLVSRILGYQRVLVDNNQGYDRRLAEVKGAVYLKGFWQTPRYFGDIKESLQKELVPKLEENRISPDAIKGIDAPNAVFLHIRRGDYVTNRQAAEAHGICSPDYYKLAINIITKNVYNPTFYVFSDDPAWVMANFPLPPKVHLMSGLTTNSPLEDLQLMRKCQHGITANSSFSWWGAFLGSDKNRIIIAPKNGFHRTLTNPDLYPAGWYLI